MPSPGGSPLKGGPHMPLLGKRGFIEEKEKTTKGKAPPPWEPPRKGAPRVTLGEKKCIPKPQPKFPPKGSS